jgi:hypothetical protein
MRLSTEEFASIPHEIIDRGESRARVRFWGFSCSFDFPLIGFKLDDDFLGIAHLLHCDPLRNLRTNRRALIEFLRCVFFLVLALFCPESSVLAVGFLFVRSRVGPSTTGAVRLGAALSCPIPCSRVPFRLTNLLQCWTEPSTGAQRLSLRLQRRQALPVRLLPSVGGAARFAVAPALFSVQ